MVASIRKLVDKYHLFLDVPALKLSIIIILPTERPETILPTAVQQKIKLPSPNNNNNLAL